MLQLLDGFLIRSFGRRFKNTNIARMEDPRGGGGAGGPVRALFFFYKSEVYEQKISIKRVRNLSRNTGNVHFIDSNFQKFLGEHAHPLLKLLDPPLIPPICYHLQSAQINRDVLPEAYFTFVYCLLFHCRVCVIHIINFDFGTLNYQS